MKNDGVKKKKEFLGLTTQWNPYNCTRNECNAKIRTVQECSGRLRPQTCVLRGTELEYSYVPRKVEDSFLFYKMARLLTLLAAAVLAPVAMAGGHGGGGSEADTIEPADSAVYQLTCK